MTFVAGPSSALDTLHYTLIDFEVAVMWCVQRRVDNEIGWVQFKSFMVLLWQVRYHLSTF